MKERTQPKISACAASEDDDERCGIFITGVVALHDGHRVALFFSGREHAGENLAKVLSRGLWMPWNYRAALTDEPTKPPP